MHLETQSALHNSAYHDVVHNLQSSNSQRNYGITRLPLALHMLEERRKCDVGDRKREKDLHSCVLR